MIKLSINSADALEKILDLNSEIGIEVTQAAAAEFAKRHLKTIVNDVLFKQVRYDLERSIRTLIKEEVGEHQGNYIILNEHVSDVIKGKIKSELDGLISKEVESYLNNNKEEINKTIKSNVDYYQSQLVKKTHESMLRKAIDIINKMTTKDLIDQ